MVEAMHSKKLQKYEKSKTMWIPKRLLEAQQSKKKSKSIAKIVVPPSKPSKSISPSPPSSILDLYAPKSLVVPPSKSQNLRSIFPPSIHHPSRCVPMVISQTFPLAYAPNFQHLVHYPAPLFHPAIPLIQSFA